MKSLTTSHYLEAFSQQPLSKNNWINVLRQQHIEKFQQLGFPHRKIEDWKYTPVTAIAKGNFVMAQNDIIAAEQIAEWQNPDHINLVFINGHFDEKNSDKYIQFTPMADLIQQNETTFKKYFNASIFEAKNNAFTALNSAFFTDGAFIQIHKNQILEKPIHLLFINTKDNSMQHTRNIIVADANSQATIIESHLALNEHTYFANHVSEIFCEDNSIIHHYKNQQESPNAYHIASLNVSQQGHSQFHSHTFSFGGLLTRSDTHSKFLKAGGHCYLHGLFVTKDKQHMDHHTSINHSVPHCVSDEFYKGILDDKSRGVFNGKIYVAKDAQKTQSAQTNKNLLLSTKAEIDTKPELEIYADDVKCAHGATVGYLDENQIFYLCSRGIPKEQAQAMLTHAFANEIIETITDVDLKKWFKQLLANQLPEQSLIEEIA